MQMIKFNNTKALAEAIREAEGRARVRTISPEVIVSALERVEKYLKLPKRALDGVKISVDPYAQKFPRAYKYVPESTHFSAIYRKSANAWYVTDIYRAPCRGPGASMSIALSDAAKDEILERISGMCY